MTKKQICISATGHRPPQLGGYDYSSPVNIAIGIKIRNRLLHYLQQEYAVHAISGMALGTDTIFALVVLKLKEQGYDITLECAIPCKDHHKIFPEQAQKTYLSILERADKVTMISNEKYAPVLMQKRNIYLVNKCQELIAVFNGTKGGTSNCIDYAKNCKRDIFYIDPRSLVIKVKGNLLKSDCDVMMHQANCQSTMGSGVAKQVKEMYPRVYQVDLNFKVPPEEKLGRYSSTTVTSYAGKQVEFVNLYGQLDYARNYNLKLMKGVKEQHTDHEALRSALFSFLEDLKGSHGDEISNLKIGLPYKMGCVRGGGDWDIVLADLEEAAEKFKIHIYTYEYEG